MRFAIFPVHLSKVLRLPRKIDARSYEVLHLSRKIILANPHIWYSKMQPLSGNQRPDLPTSLMNTSFVLRLPRTCIFADPLQVSHACHHSWKCHKTLTFWSLLTRCTVPCACHAKRHLNLQKWCVHGVFCTFWLGNVLRATRRALFPTSQVQKVLRAPLVFCTFWLANVLRATTACTFSTSQLPKVLRAPGVLYILTCKCASRHNGVHFFISPLASWLRTRRFSEPTFRPSRATNHWKNTVFRDFPTFSRICVFLLLTLLSSNLSLLSASSLLCFSSVHIVGSLTSKLPLTNASTVGFTIISVFPFSIFCRLQIWPIHTYSWCDVSIWQFETRVTRSAGLRSRRSWT